MEENMNQAQTGRKPHWLKRLRDIAERLPAGTVIRWSAMAEKRRKDAPSEEEASDIATLRLLKHLRQTEPVVSAIDEIEKRQKG